ncbi:MAG TPA: biotin/lipoyl-binding protein, partial [Rhodobacteraceae bacterium]|nr:biotin/lipoyl-binding protein [Paracoccaceae bacterium]
MTAAHGQIRIASPTLHATVFVSIAVFLAIIAMSIAFRIEVVARGKGRVVPVGRVQVVQPELSGRVNAIHVRNGMTVEKGQVLIVLDSTDAQVQLGTIAAERDRLRIEMIRIDTLVDVLGRISSGTVASLWNADDLDLPEDLRDHPFALAQAELLRSEIGDLRASLEQIDARTEASLKSEAVTNANAERIVAALTIQRQRMDTAEKLLASGTTSRSSFLDVEQTLLELERQRDVYLREADQKQAERRALGIERRQLLANLRSGLLTRKAEIDARLALLAQEMRGAQRRLDASTLRAPVSGIVDQLKTFTIGGVVTAEAELMRIVPTNIAIEVEGVFSNQDVG